jgi:outer membrane protein TolC
MNSTRPIRLAVLAISAAAVWAQSGASDPSGYSIPTPRPINPAENTTNPGVQATQRQNPYLGSIPEKATGGVLRLSLQGAIALGLHHNLGLVESNQVSVDVRADRLRALSALLPQISANGRVAYEDISYKEIGLKLPPIPGLSLPPTSGGFGYQDARVAVTQSLYDRQLRERYDARKNDERASALSVKDARDLVVLTVGTAYFQVLSSAARVETARAQLAAAKELDALTADRVGSEVSPEIDSIRAQVQRQSAEQRMTNVVNQFEKDKLTFARIAGLPVDQKFELTDRLESHSLSGLSEETAASRAILERADLASAEAAVRAAESTLSAEKAQRLPVVSVRADYGGGGSNVSNFSQVYSVTGNISVPIYTGGRIRSDIDRAQNDLARRRAEYEDLRGRIAYDVRVAWLDAQASYSSVSVAEKNRALAEKALSQSKDRYVNGVTNYLEVVEAEETVASANENYVQSLYSFNVAMISLARAAGGAEGNLAQFAGGK